MSSLLHNGAKSTITRRLEGLCILLNIRQQRFSACHVLTVTVHIPSIRRCELFASLCFLICCVQGYRFSDSFHFKEIQRSRCLSSIRMFSQDGENVRTKVSLLFPAEEL